ncbi:MAG: sugar transferase [Acidobacteriota bacterium]|nr:sugar transferase [Acidobacteriota bacterium]
MPLAIPDRQLACLILYEKPKGEAAALIGKEPLPLLCVGNRYLVEHQLEWLSDQGFKDIALGLIDRSHATQDLVGNGERWLTRVRHVMDPHHLSFRERLRKGLHGRGNGTLVVEGSAVFRFNFPAELKQTTCFVTAGGELLPVLFIAGEDLQSILGENGPDDLPDLCARVQHRPGVAVETVDAFYHHITHIDAYREMNRGILEHPGQFIFPGSLMEDGIRRGRHVRVSANATLAAPALIGDQAYICGGAVVGSQSFIGDRAYIDSGARVVNSIIAPDTYIGRNTSFEGMYVCRNYIVDLTDKTSTFVDDPFILADLTRRRIWFRGIQRLAAISMLLPALIPFLLLLPLHRLVRGSWLSRRKVLRQPVQRNLKNQFDYQWFHWLHFEFGFFPLDIIPSLWNIARGELNFVGNPPLAEHEIESLDEMWRGDRLRGKAGCTGPAQQLDLDGATPEEILASTMYYNATRSFKGDLVLLARALLPGVHRYQRGKHGIHGT